MRTKAWALIVVAASGAGLALALMAPANAGNLQKPAPHDLVGHHDLIGQISRNDGISADLTETPQWLITRLGYDGLADHSHEVASSGANTVAYDGLDGADAPGQNGRGQKTSETSGDFFTTSNPLSSILHVSQVTPDSLLAFSDTTHGVNTRP